jgi:hypothetical protein
LAILLGYLGVARNVGEWVAEQEYRGLEWIRGSNTFYTMTAGVGALLIPEIAANVSRILGFGVITGLLSAVSHIVVFFAAAIGLGAVLLTRGGRIRPLESYYDFEEDYWADMDGGTPADEAPKGDETVVPVEEILDESALEAEEENLNDVTDAVEEVEEDIVEAVEETEAEKGDAAPESAEGPEEEKNE